MLLKSIKQKIHKCKNVFHEIKNEQELRKIVPNVIVYDICHQFCIQEPNSNIASTTVFNNVVTEQPFINHNFFGQYYLDATPQQQIAKHGATFNALFNVYMQYTRKAFKEQSLYNHQQEYIINKYTIYSGAYNTMPKRYRGIFVPHNDSYILNVSFKNMVMSYSNKNKQKIENLLATAEKLIPLIHKPDDLQNNTNSVSDEQLKTIYELRDIFMEIAKITLPRAIKPTNKKTSGAFDIFNEYTNELTRNNCIMEANKTAKKIQDCTKAQSERTKKEYKKEMKSIKKSYEDFHKNLLNMLKEKINTHTI